MYKLNFIYHKFKHHSPYSGYNRLIDYMNGKGIDGRFPAWLSFLSPEALLRKAKVGEYNRDRLFSEIKIILKLLDTKKEIFHFLYGEDGYCYSGRAPRTKNKKIICTFHQPPEIFERCIRRRNHLHKLDGIVAVSRNQCDYFRNIIGGEKVIFIPHGIDTDFFLPGEEEPSVDYYTCLFVGHWLRDFNILKEVIQIVCSKNKNIKFQIVTREKHRKYFDNTANTEVYSGVSDNELLNFYQSASLLVMPLINCTANNSTLEALACGLPIIATDVGGIRDYLDESCAVFVKPGDAEIMAKQVLRLIEDKLLRRSMRVNARKKALNYSWPLVAQEHEKFYLNLFS